MAVPAPAAGELAPLPQSQPDRPEHLRLLPSQTDAGLTLEDWDQQLRAEAAPSIGTLIGTYEWYVIAREPEESKPYAQQDHDRVTELRERSDYWQGRIAGRLGHIGAPALSKVVVNAYRLTGLMK